MSAAGCARSSIAVLWVAVLGSSLGVIYAKHEARNRFNELQQLTRERDDLDIEWGQLQIEQSTLARHGRVEQAARDQLRMTIPQAGDLRIVAAMTRAGQSSAEAAGLAWRQWFVLGLLAARRRRAGRARRVPAGHRPGLPREEGRRAHPPRGHAVREPRHDPRPQRRAARGQHAGGHGLGRPAHARPGAAPSSRGSPRPSTATPSGSRDASPAASTASSSTSSGTCARRTPIASRRSAFPGVNTQREYRRYYPAAEVTGHLLGFTNVDDVGQEGLELAFDQWLGGVPGLKRVMRDSLGRTIADIERIRPPRPGQDLYTSIDLRVQYLAYRELKAAVQAHRARAGSVVVLDIATGEVLAMVNQPAFNPNDREQYAASRYRNRATNDVFEPGSSIKPFVVAAGLETGTIHATR